ncbi:MAG TPA: leucyl aminopeptidase [Flavobacteriia bacterium]|nr:leucyl aminopeptidase [Flavobacteriia bacterium]
MIQVKYTKKTSGNSKVILTAILDDVKELTKEEKSFFKKEFSKNEIQHLQTEKGYTIVVNTNKKEAETIRVAGYKAHKILKNETEASIITNNKENTYWFLEGFLLSNYQFLNYFSDKEKRKYKLKNLSVVGVDADENLQKLIPLIESVYWARDLVNEPVSYLDSIKLAEEIQEKGKKGNYEVEVFEKAKIEALKMGGLLAVNQGSVTPPTFTIIEYKPKNAINKKPYVLVGKGIVYDTGGLSLKPTPNSMDFMKTDMGGAACMAATIDAVAKNKLPIHIIGLIPSTDNRPGKNAYAPGDVVTMYDGTTVEVLNTDAEGRMVLADAIAYANKYNPELIIDAATLTGAAVRAVGVKTAVFMGNANKKNMDLLEKTGMETHDRVVRFPFWDEWKEELKSDIADLKNLGGPNAGMITAGKFLEHFAKHPFIHIDLSDAYLHQAINYNGKGATGAGVRLLYNFFEKLVG